MTNKANYIQRKVELHSLLNKKSLFLLGPRQTGKSTYIREQLKDIVYESYSLLDQQILLKTLSNPSWIREHLSQKKISDVLICIDEIQKCPALLDEVHWMIEAMQIRFLLTGSSARKLRRAGNINLLGGRARSRHFHPLTYPEVKGHRDFSLTKIFNTGLIPSHYLSDEPEDDLFSYVGRYLSEEISAEGMTRNLAGFSRFLEVAALSNAQLLNYENVARDTGLSRSTIRAWFQILYDTLLGFELPAEQNSLKRKAITTAKFYMFDLGVVRALRQFPPITERNKDYGDFFEHFIFLQLKSWIDYRAPRYSLGFWRSTSGFEVDFILNKQVAIEVKSSGKIDNADLKGLRALKEENLYKQFIVVCGEKLPRKLDDGIEILPWECFLDMLWSDQFKTP